MEACAPASGEKEAPATLPLPARLPSLDGWRGISILTVLGSHTRDVAGYPAANEAWFSHLFDGHLGVRFFFVISGFLITWLMLSEEKKQGTVNLRNFYIRRAVRILPVYLGFLAVVAALQIFTPFHQGITGWIGNLTFTTNYLHMTHVSDHLWSLAVEEQFYLLWPVAFVFFRPQRSLRKCLVIVGATLLAAFASRLTLALADEQSRLIQRVFHQWSFFNNADSLAIGSLAAILLARAPQRSLAFMRRSIALVMMTGAALLALPISLPYLRESGVLPAGLDSVAWLVEVCGGRTLQSAGFAILMVQSVLLADWGVYKILNWRALSQIGVLSYSLYIWQQIFCAHPQEFGLGPVWWMTYPLWLVPVAAAACLSYYGFERPLLQLRHRFR